MADIGSLSFSVHLQDMTDADAARIKKKLENLSVNLNIDGNNIKVSNTDIIKKQLEDAVKSVNVSSVKVNVDAVKQQIEGATQNLVPQVKVTLLKDNLSTDIQSYLDTKSFNVKISITKTEANNALKNLGTVAVPVTLKVNKKVALEGLKQSLLNMTVPIGVRLKSSKDLAKDIQERMNNTSVKVGIDANRNVLRSNVAQALRGQTFKANLDLVVQKASVQQAIRQAFAQAGLNYNTSASDVRQNLIDTRNLRTDAYVKAQKALEDYRRAQIGSAQAANQQNSAMERVNRTAERQKGLMAGIREQVANMYALYRIGRFLDGVIRISGEFQQQHVALQTILGDAEKADVLFQRIKGLAVESPFKFGDLTKYAKQLAAFSIPYEEMFDTLKRFGDLSAGLGVEMGRIILAYGQVRSAEFLKGTELRQFTEAGIPLVTELAKRYTELEGTLVSVGDVYDRISKKEVPFTDVKAVLWDLTNEGGRFFEMQAALTDTLKGKLDKLIDSYEIFLADLGESNNEILGGTLDMLTGILSSWKDVENAIMGIVVAYGYYKAAVLAVAAVQKVNLTLETLQGVINLTRAMQGLTAVTKAQAVAQGILNAITSANPFVLLATAIGTLVGVSIAFSKEAETEAEAMTKLHASMQQANEEAEKTKSKANDLISVMKNEKNSIDVRNKAYDDLLEIYGLLFPNMTREQVLLMDEAKLRERVARAAREERKAKAKAEMDSYESQLLKAQSKRTELNFTPIKDRGYNWESKVKEADEFIASLTRLRDEARNIYNDIDKDDQEFAKLTKQRWYTESKKIAEESGLKSLIPTDKETDVWEYFDRIKQGMDDIKKRKDMLNPESGNYSTMLGNLDTELAAYEKIYYGVLGGKNEAAVKAAEEARKKREKQLQDEAKQNEKAGKEAAKAFADGVKSEMERITSQWDLYKQLFDLTGDMQFAASAFKTTHVFDDAAKEMLSEFKKSASNQGVDWDIDFDISDSSAKALYGDLFDSWKAIKDRIEKNGIDLKVNAANAINESKSFEQQIDEVDKKLQDTLKSIEAVYGKGTPKYEKASSEAIRKAEEEKTKIRFEEFKKSSDWVKVFDDLDRVSDTTLDNMISKIEEFARQAHLSEEVTKQLVEAMAKLRDETIERNPFKGFKEAWNRASYWRNYDVNAAYNKQFNDKTGKFEQKLSQEQVDNNLAEANDDLKDSALAVADKFQAVANAADLLSGLFENLGIDLGGISDIFGGAASGAQAGAGIAAAFGAAGPWGAIAGAAVGMLSSVFAMHDKALQKEIEASEAREKAIKNMAENLESLLERTMGSIYTISLDKDSATMLNELLNRGNYWKDTDILLGGNYYSEQTRQKAQEAIREDSYYDAQLAALMAQRDELQKQKQLEDEKKKTDKNKIADYEQQIREMEIAIEEFAADMAETLYGIDFKDWANQLAEALVDAWATGEDAVKAYNDTVNDILKNVGVSVITQKIIEESLKPTMDRFITQFAKDNGQITDESMAILSEMYDGASEAAKATGAYLEGLKKLGIDLSESSDSAKGGLSKGIQSVTEDTADLLASYLNATRQDVSVNRSLLERLIGEDVPKMNYIAEAQLRELSLIQSNTAKNVALVGEIRDLVNRVVDKGSNKLKV